MNGIIRVKITSSQESQHYEPRLLSINTGKVIGCDFSSNLGYYLGYCSAELFDERVAQIRQSMEKYNEIVSFLWAIEGFKDFFTGHNSLITKKEIENKFGNLVAEKAFSLPRPYLCYPDLIVRNDTFMLKNDGYVGEFSFNDKNYSFELTGQAEDYPDEIDGKICFWNWDNQGTDYSLCFANYISDNMPKGVQINYNTFAVFDCYNQWRGTHSPIVEVIEKIFTDLENRGYLEKYKLFAENDTPIWNYYTGLSDHSVGLYLCDKKAFTDKLFVARMNALLQACSIEYDENDTPTFGALVNPSTEQIEINQPYYYLQDEKDTTYISKEPGIFGGHYKLKIYGKLDCPSAARYLAKGQYKNHQVFFADEKTARTAGYRPCGVCMKESYLLWKQEK